MMRAAATMFVVLATLPFIGAPPVVAVQATAPPDSSTLVGSDPVDWTPHVLGAVSNDERVMDIAEWGDVVVAVGRFTEVRQPGAPAVDRSHAFAFDADTGDVDTRFAPIIDGQVDAVEVTPDGSVLLGGYFETVNGESHRHIVKLDRDGQVVPGFTAWTNDTVRHIELVGSTAYLGGDFFFTNGDRHELIAAIDTATGAVDPDLALDFEEPRLRSDTLEPYPLLVRAMDISPDGTTMVVGGSFRRVDDQSRVYIAVIDLTTKRLSPWRTTGYEIECRGKGHATPIWDVEFSPDGEYMVAVTTSFRAIADGVESLCDTAARFELRQDDGSDVAPTWVNWSNGDSLTAVEITDSAVYIGGHMRWMNGVDVALQSEGDSAGRVDRLGLAALDPRSGVPLSWRADRDPRGAGVWELKMTDRGLWVGSDTDYLSGEFRGKLALLPRDGGLVMPTASPPSLPTTLFAVDGGITSFAFDGVSAASALPVVDAAGRLGTTGGATMIGGVLHTTRSDLHWVERRRFDGVRVPEGAPIDLYGLSSREWALSSVRGLTFDHRAGRLYYVVEGRDQLLWRGFSPESAVVAPKEHVADAGSIRWGSVRGLELIGDRLYFGHADGDLRSMPIDAAGAVDTRGLAVHGGPVIDGRSWDRPLFAWSPGTIGDSGSLPNPLLSEVFDADAAGESWFSFPVDVAAGDALLVRVAADDPDARLRAFVLAPDGLAVARDRSDAAARLLRADIDATGRHRVGVKIAAGSSRIRVSAETVGLDSEYSALSPDLLAGWSSWGSGTDRRWQPFDLLDLTAGQTITATVSWDNPAGDLGIFAYGPDGAQIVDIRDAASPVSFDLSPSVDGRYRLAVAVRGEPTNYDIEVTRANNPPAFDAIGVVDSTAGEAVSVQLSATDADGDRLRFVASRLPSGLVVSESGLISGVPSAPGRWYAQVTVDDRFGGVDSATMRFDVAAAPATVDFGRVTLTQPGDGSGGWVPVAFAVAFAEAPVVVAGPVSYAGTDPVVARIRNITTTGFDLSLTEWPGLDARHGRLDEVSWLAVAPGETSLGGLPILAGRADVDHTSKVVDYAGSFTDAPVVLAQTETTASADTVDVRIGDVTAAGFAARLSSAEDRVPTRPAESVGWIAIQPGVGDLDGHRVEVGTVPGDHTGSLLPIAGRRPVALFADLQTVNDADNAAARVHFEPGVHPLVWPEEDETFDEEIVHGVETIGYVSLSPLLLHGNVELDQSGDGSGDWVPVSFDAEFGQVPVVIAGPPTTNDIDAAVARVRNVTTEGFELSINEWAGIDQPHATERVSWIALAQGTHTLAGVTFTAGRVVTERFVSVGFGIEFATLPVVLSQVESVVDPAPVVARHRDVTTTGFAVSLSSAEATGRDPESIGWIAVEPGEIHLGRATVSVGIVETRQLLVPVPSEPRFPGDSFVATTQTYNGADNGAPRILSDIGTPTRLWFQEDQVEDDEVDHTTEIVGWLQINQHLSRNGV